MARKKREGQVIVRMSKPEILNLKRLAASLGLSMSAWIRLAIHKEAKP